MINKIKNKFYILVFQFCVFVGDRSWSNRPNVVRPFWEIFGVVVIITYTKIKISLLFVKKINLMILKNFNILQNCQYEIRYMLF